VLPDFFIGAHAEITRWSILTRDIGRYRTYFPDVDLIAPKRQAAAPAGRIRRSRKPPQPPAQYASLSLLSHLAESVSRI